MVTIALSNLVGLARRELAPAHLRGLHHMALPLVVFFSLQRYFVRGLTAGSVKG